MISGFCHSANEFFALLGCYAAQTSSYWCFSTTVCPNFKGQAVQAWPSDLGLHISTDLTSWSVKNKTYTYNYVLFLQTTQLGQSGTIDCDIWPDAVSLAWWLYFRGMHAICVTVKGERVTCSNTGPSRICQKEQRGGVYTVWQNYC